MPWVYFWASFRNEPESSDPDFAVYEWFDKEHCPEIMKEEALARVPTWLSDSEDRHYYGWKLIPTLPTHVRDALILEYQRRLAYADRILKILGAPRKPRSKKPRKLTTRYELLQRSSFRRFG